MEIIKKDTLINTLLFILFFFSLQEFGIQIGGDGVSANYIFIILPLVLFLLGRKHELSIPLEVVLLLIIFSFIYVVGIPNDIFNLSNMESFRRFASYAIFIAPFTLTFIKFNSLDLRLFKLAVISACIYYCLLSLYDLTYWMYVVGANIVDLKGKIGSQRYGFILLLGFFITLFGDDIFKPTLKYKVFKFIVLTVILSGIFLTFSKTSVVSLVASLLIYLALNFKIFSAFEKFTIKHIIYTSFFLLLIYIGINMFMVIYLDAFLHAISFDANNHETSLGFRIYMFDLVMQFLAENPIFGSNYKGIYALYGQLSVGSTHNQFLDVLLRVGLIGFIVWMYIVYRILLTLKADKALFFGFISILIYGFMHETFKLAWGGFIFGMLLSFSYSSVFLFKEKTG